MKTLGLDFGTKTIGVAIYDDSVDFIYPLDTIWRKKNNVIRESLRNIDKIIEKENIQKIIIGLPITMKDTEGVRAKASRDFGEKVSKRYKEKNIDVFYQDERLTTIEASEILSKNNIKKSEQKKYIDSVAAMVILNEYKNSNV